MIDAEFAIGLDLLDEAACRSMWVRQLHPAGPSCPTCGVTLTGVQAETFSAGGKIHCRSCGRWSNCRTGTPLQNLVADWRQLTMLAAMTNQQRSTAEIAAVCRLSEDTVRRYQRRLLEVT